MKYVLAAFVFVVSLSTTIIVGLLRDAPTAVAPPSPTQVVEASDAGPPPGESAPELSDSEQRILALNAIDELGAHPDDPQNPPGVVGRTDEQVASISVDEVSELFSLCEPAARESPLRSHYLFVLGRIALLHDQVDIARELLKEAAAAGSAAASGYLGVITEDEAQALVFLEKSAKGGFSPASSWLAERQQSPETAFASKPFAYSDFRGSRHIKALHQGQFAELRRYPLESLMYALGLLNGWEDDQVLFLLEPEAGRKFRMLQTPGLKERAAAKFASKSAIVETAGKSAMDLMMKGLNAMVETRKRGGSIEEEVAAVNGALGAGVAVREVVQADGLYDAKSLALMVGTHFADVERVIHHLEDFCLDRPPRHGTIGDGATGPYDPAEDYDRGLKLRSSIVRQ